ncbi:MAG: GDSL-type esterase/lipase family protein [Cyanobacteria bacterium P01_A01_bin.114]
MLKPVLDRVPRLALKIPGWAALSLLMNAVLFMALLASWHEKSGGDPSVLPQANAAAAVAQPVSEPALLPTASKPRLSYEQWVDLLKQEMDAMTVKHPDHLTILLGDSLSLWFPAELLPGRRVWMNQAISGEKTQGVLARLHLLDQAEIDTIFVMIGINDLIWGKSDDQIIRNYRQIMDYLKRYHPDTKIVVQSILPHGAETATWESRDRLLALPNSRVRAMNESLQEIAYSYDAYYLDLYPIFSTGEGNLRTDLTTDGLHLNREGYLVWRTAIAMYSQVELQ